eukprot:m.71003 g.71003  ORF g.71003 m.71003 type:complete len:125 (-) comp12279_c0_seq1:227-601(-)
METPNNSTQPCNTVRRVHCHTNFDKHSQHHAVDTHIAREACVVASFHNPYHAKVQRHRITHQSKKLRGTSVSKALHHTCTLWLVEENSAKERCNAILSAFANKRDQTNQGTTERSWDATTETLS